MPRTRRNIHSLKRIFALCQLLWRNPSLFWGAFALTGGWYAYEVTIARPPMVFQGVPETQNWRDVSHWFRVLRNEGFILGYSDLRGNPLWVMYKLKPIQDNAPNLKRLNYFSPDWRALPLINHDSYSGSGYDRGHMAPNYAMSRLYGATAQADSFLMTNITPQKANLNQKLWQRLEALEVDRFTRHFGEIWVLTGPVFDHRIERLKSSWAVEVPDAFYKIYVAQAGPERLTALAFLVPQSVNGKEPLEQYLTDIDTIEAKTGLDFFPKLDDKIEKDLEAAKDSGTWRLQEAAR